MTAARKSASGKSNAKDKGDAKTTIVEVAEDGTRKIVVDPSIDKSVYVEQALADPQILETIVDSLCGEARRARQFCATIVAEIAKVDPSALEPSIDCLIDALHRPEAQTRWEILGALYYMVPACLDKSTEAEEGAEESLWDEDSGPARLAAFRFLCALGAADPEVSKEVWPQIDEAIRCYHGDLEFTDMLGELIAFANGNADQEVKDQLAARMKFDADNGKGVLGNKASTIVEACKAK